MNAKALRHFLITIAVSSSLLCLTRPLRAAPFETCGQRPIDLSPDQSLLDLGRYFEPLGSEVVVMPEVEFNRLIVDMGVDFTIVDAAVQAEAKQLVQKGNDPAAIGVVADYQEGAHFGPGTQLFLVPHDPGFADDGGHAVQSSPSTLVRGSDSTTGIQHLRPAGTG